MVGSPPSRDALEKVEAFMKKSKLVGATRQAGRFRLSFEKIRKGSMVEVAT